MKRILLLLACVMAMVTFFTKQSFAKGWEYQKSGVKENLNAVCFVDQDYGWAVGDNNTIISTEDGGETWKAVDITVMADVPSPSFEYNRFCNFHSVYFIDKETGWIAGEVNLPVMNPEDLAPIPVRFALILHTEDGGMTWTCQYPCKEWTDIASGIRQAIPNLNDIFFINKKQGRAVGEGFIYLTTEDGGETWKETPIGLIVIPEIRQTLTSTYWLSPERGAVSGYFYDMFTLEKTSGFIAHTEDGGKTWELDSLSPNPGWFVPPLIDLEIKGPVSAAAFAFPAAWTVGEEGAIFHLTSSGWERQGFAWPISLPLPDFNAVSFVDLSHGWIVGSHRGRVGGVSDTAQVMTIFKTADGGNEWTCQGWTDPGVLNDVQAIAGTDVWAVGDRGTVIHYENSAPEVCTAWAEPRMVYAGDTLELHATIKDLDGPRDIEKVIVDASSIGVGIVELKPLWLDLDERRCVHYWAELKVPELAAYGSHQLPVKVVDTDGARASGMIELFVITSWVDIQKTWAKPNPVPRGKGVLLAAEVRIVAPKSPEGDGSGCPYNEIEKVMVDITQLLDVDCAPETDCIIIREMTDPDGDGIYTCKVELVSAAPGRYELPVWAVDTLGHRDKSIIKVSVVEELGCRFDYDFDQDVDGVDLAVLAKKISESQVDKDQVKMFALEFGRTNCPVLP